MTSDEGIIQRAEAGLSTLVHLDTTTTSETTVTHLERALRVLRDRLQATRTRQADLRMERDERMRVAAAADAHHHRVENDIIDTRVREGDMQMTRDALARDVGRARRALRAVDESVQADVDLSNFSWSHLCMQASQPDEDVGEEGEIVNLKRNLAEEMNRLKFAEMQLVDVADEIMRVRKKRTDLRRKMKDAEQEW